MDAGESVYFLYSEKLIRKLICTKIHGPRWLCSYFRGFWMNSRSTYGSVCQRYVFTVKTGVSVHPFINDTPRGVNLNYGF